MDLGQRIQDAKNASNTSMNSYNQYAKQAGNAQGQFNTGLDKYQNTSFGDIYGASRDQYMNTDEINAARSTYQSARDAVDQMNTTINKLPESIRQQYGGTGLTEAQRARAMSSQYSQLENTQKYLNTNYANASTNYNDLANRGLQEAMFTATGTDSRELAGLNALQNAWTNLLGQENTAYSRNQGDRGLLADQYTARDDWSYKQQMMELERWKEQQANARAAADRANAMNLQKYLASSNERIAGMQYQKPTTPTYQSAVAPTQNKQPNLWDKTIGGFINWAGNGIADAIWNNNIFNVRGSNRSNGGGGW